MTVIRLGATPKPDIPAVSRRRRWLPQATQLPWTARAGIGVFLVICLLLVLAPWISPANSNVMHLNDRLAAPSLSQLLGTDAYGRDVASRLLNGGRFSVTIAGITVVFSAAVGTLVGIVSGRVGGLVDEIAMRTADVLLAFPDMLLALVLIVILGPGPKTVVIAMTAF